MIRLFTSGTHKGLTFSNEDIEGICEATATQEENRIPIVLGHPKNDLPIVGFLPTSAMNLYQEGEKLSVGFDRDKAELSEESVEALRKLGNNKISVRLKEGMITHIGLVKKAAVAENNDQDFGDGTAIYHTDSDFEQPGEKNNILKIIKQILPMKEKEPTDFSVLETKVEALVGSVGQLTAALTAQQKQKEAEITKIDFAAPEFSHLSDAQRKQVSDFAAGIEDATKREVFKTIIASANVKPKVVQGSVTADFAATKQQDNRTAADLIAAQMQTL